MHFAKEELRNAKIMEETKTKLRSSENVIPACLICSHAYYMLKVEQSINEKKIYIYTHIYHSYLIKSQISALAEKTQLNDNILLMLQTNKA